MSDPRVLAGVHHSDGPGDTEALGARLAATVVAGDVILVLGEVGAGKTTFVRGACRALGFEGRVSSPTFALAHRYDAPTPIAHLDLHRVGAVAGEEPELLEDELDSEAVGFVEWPSDDLTLEQPARWVVRITHESERERRVELTESR